MKKDFTATPPFFGRYVKFHSSYKCNASSNKPFTKNICFLWNRSRRWKVGMRESNRGSTVEAQLQVERNFLVYLPCHVRPRNHMGSSYNLTIITGEYIAVRVISSSSGILNHLTTAAMNGMKYRSIFYR